MATTDFFNINIEYDGLMASSKQGLSSVRNILFMFTGKAY